MSLRLAILLIAITESYAAAQGVCPAANFLNARSVNLKPNPNSHIDVVRQSDGSYTGFEVADAPPYRKIATTPHFERQWGACLPHILPEHPAIAGLTENPAGAPPQLQVAAPVGSGNYFAGSITGDQSSIRFDVFDSQHALLSESTFSWSAPDPPTSPFNRTDFFQALSLADMNGDGKLDLIAVFDSSRLNGVIQGGVWIFRGNGDGTFQAGKRNALRTNTFLQPAASFAVADVNGDKKPDVLLSGYASTGSSFDIVIATGLGDGSLNTAALAVSGLNAPAFAIADLNGDGKTDLILNSAQTTSNPTTISVRLGNGDGSFQAANTFPILPPGAIFSVTVATGDINGDSIPDIVTSTGTILFGDGKGGFPSRRDYALNAAGSVMLGDVDGDGNTDIILGNGNPAYLSPYANLPAGNILSATVLFGAGSGVFTGAPISGFPFNPSGPHTIAAADFTDDGIPDILLTSTTNSVLHLIVFQGQGQGQFLPAAAQLFPIPANTGIESTTTADFDRNGSADVAVLLSSGDVLVFSGRGDGSFATPVTITVPADDAHSLQTPDVNGDGIPDLAVTSTSAVFLSLAKGDGTFSAPVLLTNGTSPGVAFGDFNGDGKLDAAVAKAGSTSIRILAGKGDGEFTNINSSLLPLAALGSPGNIIAADFDNDGRLDIGVILQVAGPQVLETAVLTGRGDGAFGAIRTTSGALSPMLAADINGDKILDLVGNGAGGLAVRLGNGDGTFQGEAPIFSRAVSFAIADLDRSGTPDLAVLSQAGIAAFLNLSQTAPPLAVVSAASFAPGPIAPGSIAAAFGTGLAGGTVTIEDSAGINRGATVFFTSANQINFLVPPGAAGGVATVTVNGLAAGKALTAHAQIAAIAPALFTVGSNIAAAYAVRVAPEGSQTVVPVFTSQGSSITAAPLDVTQPGQLYLILFGTGFDAASASSTTVTVQGVNCTVTYAGPQGTYAGLDQIDVLLPASLARTGVAAVAVSIGGQTTNEALVTIGSPPLTRNPATGTGTSAGGRSGG